MQSVRITNNARIKATLANGICYNIKHNIGVLSTDNIVYMNI